MPPPLFVTKSLASPWKFAKLYAFGLRARPARPRTGDMTYQIDINALAAQVAADKPAELIRLSLTRARFAELLAISHGKLRDTGMAFLTGMMSLMDAILDEDMPSVMGKLPLTNEIKGALLHGEGLLATYLRLVKFYEQAEWDKAKDIQEELGLKPEEVPDAYHDALSWSNEQMGVFGD